MTLVAAVLERVGFRRPQYESVKKVIDDQGFITETTLTLDRNLYPAPEVSFTGCLNALPKAASAEAEKLLLYLNQCEQGNTYDASLACYEYLGEKPRGCVTAAYHDEMLAFEIGAPTGLQPSDKVSTTLEILQQFCRERSQKPFPARLPRTIEAAALAVSRHLCVRGEAQTAHDLIQALAPLAPRSIHLRAVEQAVGILLKGSPVPRALQKFVGPDIHALQDRFCPIPFGRADIHQGGEVVMCCSHWLPTVIGNVFNNTTDQILNSDVAKDIRKSVVDGSFKYCSHADCELIVNDKLPKKSEYAGRDYVDNDYAVPASILDAAFSDRSYEIDHVSFLTFCLDRTCNLTCPSCRTHLIMVKDQERERLYDATERAVLPMLRGAKRAMINPSGEAFVSRPSRRLLEALAQPGYQDVVVDIITNGTVCSKEEWDKFSHLYGRIHFIRVSMDAASKETFEKLRRGANWETVVANLRNISDMHRKGYCKNYTMSFTYQRDNLREMEDFVKFGSDFGVSAVLFERLQNIGTFTPEEFQERAVHLVDHPLHQEFLDRARKVKLDPKVYIDFDP